jgi:uncharacterized protein (DUF2236 family)
MGKLPRLSKNSTPEERAAFDAYWKKRVHDMAIKERARKRVQQQVWYNDTLSGYDLNEKIPVREQLRVLFVLMLIGAVLTFFSYFVLSAFLEP